MPKPWLEKVNLILWWLLLLALPITSFPPILRVLGGNSVAPLSLVPLVLLALASILPTILKTKRLPMEVTPLLLLFGVGVIATSVNYFRDIPTFRDTAVFRNALEGFLTLITGVAFFLAPIYMIKTELDLKRSLQVIYIAFGIILLFCLLQASTWLVKDFEYPLHQFQSLLSSSGKIFIRRVYGLAFEPSWLAHQLNILFIPLFLAASYYGFELTKIKLFRRFSLEILLLIVSVGLLFLSFSRIGWITGLLLLAVMLFRVGNSILYRKEKPGVTYPRWRRVAIWIGIFIFLSVLAVGLGFILTKIDPRNAKLFDLERFRNFGFLGWASQLGIAERVVFWMAAYQVYLLHPLLGVGFGGAGYFFQNVMPSYGYRLPEIAEVITTGNFIPNAKNLWVRLLAETGVVGFICFLLWIYVVAKAAFGLEKNTQPLIYRFVGMFGKLSLIALLVEGFSTDTFGLPYFWLVFGMVVAVSRLKPAPEKSTDLK